MAALLRAVVRRSPTWEYPRRLLGVPLVPVSQDLVARLSERELDVLRLLRERPERAGHRP